MEGRSFAYKFSAWVVITLVTSLYFFPVVLTFFPIANTKMTLAGLGLVWFIYNVITSGKKAELTKDLFFCSLLAIAVSFVGFLSMLYNDTNDDTYATYIVSMWVWMGGAYFCINTIRFFHGKASALIVSNYLIAVCVFQCVSALLIRNFPFVSDLATRLISDFAGVDSMAEIKGKGRLYGFGAALDPAGTRFAAVLVIISYIFTQTDKKTMPIYMIAYMVILLVGDMIARTTVVGAALSVLLVVMSIMTDKGEISDNGFGKWAALIVGATVLMSVYLYNHNDNFYTDVRFAFEGFFALVEDGYWHTNSNDMLMHMYVFPDNIKTWLIGDGYFNSPDAASAPYFIGYNKTTYYMGTDVGYCRFIFYFGLIGLALFIAFFMVAAYYCSKNCRGFSLVFLFIAVLNYIVWLKVATDLFLILALFLCLTPEENEEENLLV